MSSQGKAKASKALFDELGSEVQWQADIVFGQ